MFKFPQVSLFSNSVEKFSESWNFFHLDNVARVVDKNKTFVVLIPPVKKLSCKIDLAHTAGDALADGVVGHAGGAVEHQGNRDNLPDLAQAVNIQLGDALVDAVGGADGNGQRIDPGALDELGCLSGFGVAVAAAAVQIVLLAADLAQLGLDGDARCMAGPDHRLGDLDVLLKHVVGPVNHDGGVTGAEGLHGQLKAAAVVQMHDHGDRSLGIAVDRAAQA